LIERHLFDRHFVDSVQKNGHHCVTVEQMTGQQLYHNHCVDQISVDRMTGLQLHHKHCVDQISVIPMTCHKHCHPNDMS
jgi:hypothetical protein